MAIISKPPGTIDPPNNPTAEAQPAVGVPIVKTSVAQPAVAIPNNPTAEAQPAVAIPNNPTAEAQPAVAIPNNPTAEAQPAVAIPIAKTSIAQPVVGAPNVLSAVVASALPRSLTPLVSMDFAAQCYAQNGNPVLFNNLFTYARNSSATFMNRRIVNNKAEFFLDTDFVGTVTNLLTFSDQFDNAIWIKSNTTVVANAAKAQDGTMTADLVYPTTTGTIRTINQTVTGSVVDHTLSYDVKSAGFTWVRIMDEAGGSGAWFNIVSGTIGTIFGGVASIIPLGDGWFRCSMTDVGAVSNQTPLLLSDADGSTTATTDGTSGVYISRAQLTASAKSLPYVKTISASDSTVFAESIRVEYDPATGENLGVRIEGGSTNLALRSEEFDNASWTKSNSTITANDEIAPDDTTSGDKLEAASTASILPFVSQSVTTVISTVYTTSYYVKKSEASFVQILYDAANVTGSPRANFDLSLGVLGTVDSEITASIKDIGGGWYRISSTVTAAQVTLNSILSLMQSATDARSLANSWTAGDGAHIFGGQVEAQPFSTSLIRTEGSTVSRSADDLTIPSAGNFTVERYSVTASFDLAGFTDDASSRYVFTTDSASLVAIQAKHGSGDNLRMWNDNIASLDGVLQSGISYKFAGVFSGSLQSLYLDGTIQDSDTSTVSDTPTIVNIGKVTTTSYLFGHIKTLSIYEEALTAQEVALL